MTPTAYWMFMRDSWSAIAMTAEAHGETEAARFYYYEVDAAEYALSILGTTDV